MIEKPTVSFKVTQSMHDDLVREAHDTHTDLSKYCRMLLKVGRKVYKQRQDLMIELVDDEQD